MAGNSNSYSMKSLSTELKAMNYMYVYAAPCLLEIRMNDVNNIKNRAKSGYNNNFSTYYIHSL